MKKIIAILLSITCLLGVIPVFASEVEEEILDLDFTLSTTAENFFFYAELLDGYFAKGESPSHGAIIKFLMWDIEYNFEEYIVPGEDDYFTTYNIPAEEFEAFVFTYFTQSDAITNMLRSSDYYIADGGYYEIVVGGGFGDMLPDFNYYGYEKQEDGSYVAYATLTSEYIPDPNSYDYIKYVPGADEVEGKDYIYVPSTWIPNGDLWSIESIENVDVNHGYIPVKLIGYVKSEMICEEVTDGYATYTVATLSSYEKVTGEGYPSSDSITIYEASDDDTVYENIFTALDYGAYVSFDENSFDKKTVVTSKIITEGENYEKAVAAFGDNELSLTVYDFTATLDGQAVQPDAPINVIFYASDDYIKEYALYSISDDGTAEAVEFSIGNIYGVEYMTAYLPSCSTYVLTGTIDTEAVSRAIHSTLSDAAEQYYYHAEPSNGYFAEGESPSAETIMPFLYEILVHSETGDYSETYNIPSEALEAVAFKYFTQSESLVATLRASSYYHADGDYYELSSLGAYIYHYSDFVYYGYEPKEDGSYVAYATLTRSQIWNDELIDYVEYVPGENDVEGIDYIYMPASWLENDNITTDSFDNVEINHGYIPVKIDGYIKSVMTYDENTASATITSYEKVTGEGFPSSDSIVTFETPEEYQQLEEVLNTLILGSYVSFDEESFDKKTVVTSTKVTEGENHEKAKAALDGIATLLSVFDITAELDGTPVQPGAPVKVSFALPEGFTGTPALFYVSDDGEVEEIECTVDYEYGIVTTYLSHFSIYVLAEKSVSTHTPGDVNGDGTVDTKDLTRLMKYLAGEDVVTAVNDINGDGTTNSKDLTRLMKHLAGEDVEIF